MDYSKIFPVKIQPVALAKAIEVMIRRCLVPPVILLTLSKDNDNASIKARTTSF